MIPLSSHYPRSGRGDTPAGWCLKVPSHARLNSKVWISALRCCERTLGMSYIEHHHGTVFPVSVVVGAALPAAVCRWGCACAVLVWGGVYREYTYHHHRIQTHRAWDATLGSAHTPWGRRVSCCCLSMFTALSFHVWFASELLLSFNVYYIIVSCMIFF